MPDLCVLPRLVANNNLDIPHSKFLKKFSNRNCRSYRKFGSHLVLRSLGRPNGQSLSLPGLTSLKARGRNVRRAVSIS